MTDSPRLEEVFAAVLAEHRLDDHECDCGYLFNTTFTDDEVFALHAVHQAERLAARFEGCVCEQCNGAGHDGATDPNGEPNPGFCRACRGSGLVVQGSRFAVFRLVGGDQ